jgi:hypothetical protein
MEGINFKSARSEGALIWVGFCFWDDMPALTPTLDALVAEWA